MHRLDRDPPVAGEGSRPIGRHDEQAALADLLERAQLGPASLGIVGPAGIGKTELVRHAVRSARSLGLRVAELAPTATETGVANAGLRDLVAQLDPAVVADLPRPQRHAIEVAVAAAAPSTGTGRLALLAAVHELLDRSADDGPLLVVVDDLQWLDGSTAAALQYASRRVAGPVGFLWGRRSGAESADGADHLGDPHASVELGGLDAVSLADVVRTRERRLDPSVVDDIVGLADGNPFVAVQLTIQLGVETGGRSGPTLATLPRSMDALLASRLEQVPASARELLHVASAAASPTVDLLRRTATDPAELVASLDAAEEAGIVELGDGTVRFVHPLLRHACYASMAPTTRREVHRRLADATPTIDERARHLALAAIEPDAEVLDALDVAAATTAERGAPGEAAELLELGLALGPHDPDGDRRRTVAAAGHRVAAGDLRRAAQLLERVLDAPVGTAVGPDPALARARGLRATISLLEGDLATARAEFERTAANAPDPALRAWASLSLAFLLTNTGAVDQARAVIEQAERDEALLDPSLQAALGATATMVRYLSGDAIDWDRIDAAVEHDRPGSPLVPTTSRPLLVQTLLLHMAGRLTDAVRSGDRLRDQLRDEGDEAALALVDFWVAWVWCALGRFDEAEARIAEAAERARAIDTPFTFAVARSTSATLAAWRGDAERCRADADAAIEVLGAGSPRSVWPIAAAGLLELSLGDLGAALERYQPLVAVASAMGLHQGTAAWWTPELIEVLAGLGRADDARELLAHYDVDQLGRPAIDAHAVASRCAGLVAAASGDLDDAEALLRRALDEHAGGEDAIARARTELHLGALLRRRGRRRAARDVLERSLATFEAVGARAWAEQARTEVARLGLRPRPGSEQVLTPAELEVASLVATGMSNREVAGSLRASPKTVEAHLTRIYRKLGVRTRAELVASWTPPA